jgi:hypothetical protein
VPGGACDDSIANPRYVITAPPLRRGGVFFRVTVLAPHVGTAGKPGRA